MNIKAGEITKCSLEVFISLLEPSSISIEVKFVITKNDIIKLFSNKRVANQLLSFYKLKYIWIEYFYFDKIYNKHILELNENLL